MIDEDMKIGYNIGCQRLNEEIDTMINELHNAYMNHTNKEAKDRMDAQIKILWSFKSRIEDAIVDSIEIAKEQEPKTDWIPCEERLPSENGLYLATFECEDEIVVDIMFMIGKQFYYPEDAIGNFGRSVEVIAWQPLPQPYKKEGNSNENT